MLYNAFLSCPFPRLNQRNPFTDVMSYKCYQSIWVSHTETSREIEHLSINCQHGINYYYYFYSSYACWEFKHKETRLWCHLGKHVFLVSQYNILLGVSKRIIWFQSALTLQLFTRNNRNTGRFVSFWLLLLSNIITAASADMCHASEGGNVGHVHRSHFHVQQFNKCCLLKSNDSFWDIVYILPISCFWW